MADTGTMKLLVNTPERVFFTMVKPHLLNLATSEGEIGVYPQHIPLTAVLVPCVLSYSPGMTELRRRLYTAVLLKSLRIK